MSKKYKTGCSAPNRPVSYAGCFMALAQFTLILLMFAPAYCTYADIYFNPRFLSDEPDAVADLSAFEKGQSLLPGTYRVDIYLNNSYITTRDVNFSTVKNSPDLAPCLTRAQLASMGVNITLLTSIQDLPSDACAPLTEMGQDISVHLDVSKQQLDLSFPQAFMKNSTRGYIDPQSWDNGINAGLVNYNFTGNNVSDGTGSNNNYAYLNLQSGLNIGAWRFRDNSTWSYNSGSGSRDNKNQWRHVNSWLERDIITLRSRLTLGDSYTNGDLFDGINFRGVQLASDDNMLPDSQRGFAPAIHGIARSTSQVLVRQNGYEIYQTTVSPGPFTINDLYAAGNGGDLQVQVKEADGSSQNFSVRYSSVPVLQREGLIHYTITAGEYRSGNPQQETPFFFQSILQRGLPDGLTLFGGTQLASRYRAFNFGAGKNMGRLGALSVDITQANATLPDDSKRQGQSVRLLYNKSLNNLGTTIQLVGYRYSTRGYFSFADTTYQRMQGYSVATQDGEIKIQPNFSDFYNLAYSKRGQIQLSLTQQLNKSATLYVSGSRQSYWDTDNVDEQLQAGINSAISDINWTLNYSMSRNAWQKEHEQMLAFNVSIPFSHWIHSDSHSFWRQSSASYSMSHNLNGRMSNLAGLYGTLLEDNNLSYSLQTGYMDNGNSTGYTALNYRGAYGNANVGYSHSNSIKQFYYGISGGALVHADGITLSQPLNDTAILVKAPGADNVKIENQTGVKTDWRGYAVLPYATDYRENRVALNTNSLADNVDLSEAVMNVVPTHGAIVRAEFKTRLGIKLLLTLTHKGKPVPFGAIATATDRQNSSIVADNGQVYLSGMPLTGRVKAQWGSGPQARCIADYSLPEESQSQTLRQLSAVCR